MLFLVFISCSKEPMEAPIANLQFEKKSSIADELDNSALDGLYYPEKIVKDVSYGVHPEEKFDIYLPSSRSYLKTKVLIVLHGGGWTNGDKSGMENFVEQLWHDNPDHAIVNMNYVLADASNPAFPNQFQNIRAVIAFLTNNKVHFKIKPEFALLGNSSGGHLSLMYDYVYDLNDQVKFVSTTVGPTDFTDPYYQNLPNFEDLMELLVDENVYPNIEENLDVLSPAHNTSHSSSPTIMFYGENDPVVPYANAITLYQELQESGVPTSFHTYDGGHNNWSAEDNNHKHQQLNAFIQQYLPIE
ncbi:alpha/beta hydrolase [Flavobacteriaceae bacterium TK19130]|nr:alpha/beta hydrolase [Thermobacterium salinum]